MTGDRWAWNDVLASGGESIANGIIARRQQNAQTQALQDVMNNSLMRQYQPSAPLNYQTNQLPSLGTQTQPQGAMGSYGYQYSPRQEQTPGYISPMQDTMVQRPLSDPQMMAPLMNLARTDPKTYSAYMQYRQATAPTYDVHSVPAGGRDFILKNQGDAPPQVVGELSGGPKTAGSGWQSFLPMTKGKGQSPDDAQEAYNLWYQSQVGVYGAKQGIATDERIRAGTTLEEQRQEDREKLLQDSMSFRQHLSDMKNAGYTNSTKTMIEAAPTVKQFISRIRGVMDKYSTADDPQGNRGMLGPVHGRWNEFWTGAVGAPNADYTAMRTDTELLKTLLLRMHVGARGGQYLMEHFSKLIDVGKSDPVNLESALSEIDWYADTLINEGQHSSPVTGGGAGSSSTTSGTMKIHPNANQDDSDLEKYWKKPPQ